jgi:hypothetical protein
LKSGQVKTLAPIAATFDERFVQALQAGR